MDRFLLIVQFMTRIPIKKSFDVTVDDFRMGVRYFPIIGLIVGVITGFFVYVSSYVFSPFLAGFIGMVSYVITTGGLHLDGFSDTCDGIFSGREKDKILTIMSDSRLGTFGGVGLIVLLLGKMTLYTEALLSGSLRYGIGIIIASSIVSRGVVTFYMYNRKYAKENSGLGDLFIGKITKKELIINQVIFICLSLIIWWKFIFIYPLVAGIMIFIRNKIEKLLGGLTGDILGFSIELSEVIFLVLAIGGVSIWNLYL
ncbi:MAG: adenosylcobinamide-GDP ribazoletransferase [Clostridium sp.]|uniref:adenosylcobinamide-GDP ribazoletransferase n=1 Tax=Clostridium sp. TaxID=1506 RepID=UPI002FCC3B76